MNYQVSKHINDGVVGRELDVNARYHSIREKWQSIAGQPYQTKTQAGKHDWVVSYVTITLYLPLRFYNAMSCVGQLKLISKKQISNSG